MAVRPRRRRRPRREILRGHNAHPHNPFLATRSANKLLRSHAALAAIFGLGQTPASFFSQTSHPRTALSPPPQSAGAVTAGLSLPACATAPRRNGYVLPRI